MILIRSFVLVVSLKTFIVLAKINLNIKNIKISHTSIHKWIKGFGSIFKDIVSKYTPQDLYLSDKLHVNQTVIKIKVKRYCIWTLINSKTIFTVSTFQLFDEVKK